MLQYQPRAGESSKHSRLSEAVRLLLRGTASDFELDFIESTMKPMTLELWISSVSKLIPSTVGQCSCNEWGDSLETRRHNQTRSSSLLASSTSHQTTTSAGVVSATWLISPSKEADAAFLDIHCGAPCMIAISPAFPFTPRGVPASSAFFVPVNRARNQTRRTWPCGFQGRIFVAFSVATKTAFVAWSTPCGITP